MPDDAEERRSAAGQTAGPGVTPNASKDAQWRKAAAGTYSASAGQAFKPQFAVNSNVVIQA